jgi:glutaredoxin-related protein
MELLEYLEQTIKEYEIVNWKIETKENYISFLRILNLQNYFEDKKEDFYWRWIYDKLSRLNNDKKILETFSNKKK